MSAYAFPFILIILTYAPSLVSVNATPVPESYETVYDTSLYSTFPLSLTPAPVS